MLRERGHEVRTAIRLTDELADWADGIVRFAPYPGPPARRRGGLVPRLARRGSGPLADLCRARLRYRAEYWKTCGTAFRIGRARPPRGGRGGTKRRRPTGSTGCPRRQRPPPIPANGLRSRPRLRRREPVPSWSGPWAEGIDAAAAALDRCTSRSRRTAAASCCWKGTASRWSSKSRIGRGRVLVIANGSFLLNEAVVNPARRPLAERVVEWAGERPPSESRSSRGRSCWPS